MAGKRFNKVHPALWRSSRFLEMDSDSRLLHLYFLTNEHQTSAGAYRLPDGYASADLGWSIERYRGARLELVEAGLIAFDEANEAIYVERWFKHNPPQNEKHAQGTRRLLETIDSDAIREKATADFEESYSARGAVNVSPQLRGQLVSHLQPVGGGRR